MTDELKFFDPETGKPLHRVPDGATIPKGTPYGFIRPDGTRGWKDGGARYTFNQLRDHTYFTREPIAPPLPTEPGSIIRAADVGGDEYAVMVRLYEGRWQWVDRYGYARVSGDEAIRDWDPVTIVPTETWERLRVFDPEVKLDRVDSEGRVWRYRKDFDGWESENGVRYYYLEVLDNNFGPLRLADEVSDDE